MIRSVRKYVALMGPGLLYAGAAVGVSHLVQSTRAGAEFGFQLLWIIVLVNVIKYPVFEIGPRYASATGKSLLDGYLSIGKWAVYMYAVMSITTMFIILSSIGMVTAGLCVQLADIGIEPRLVAIILVFVAAIILGIGQYATLDRLMKVIVVALTFTTLLALVFAFTQPSLRPLALAHEFNYLDDKHLLFLVALIGWMPAPVDISVWHSVWSVSKMKERGRRIELKTALLDFKIGYWGTTLLACCFLSLGARELYGSGIALASDGTSFSNQLIGMFTNNIGQWAFPFIAAAAFTTMFSTLLTCLDAFPRTLRKSTKLLAHKLAARKFHRRLYINWLFITCVGTAAVLLFFLADMRQMVDLATTISFVIAPILATLNFLAMNNGLQVAPEYKQPKWLKRFNLVSIAMLYLFSIWFLV